MVQNVAIVEEIEKLIFGAKNSFFKPRFYGIMGK